MINERKIMASSYSIGQVANLLGLTIDTIRYYR